MIHGWGDNEKTYSEKQMKTEPENHYADNISITTVGSKPNVVTLKVNVKMIFHERRMLNHKNNNSLHKI